MVITEDKSAFKMTPEAFYLVQFETVYHHAINNYVGVLLFVYIFPRELRYLQYVGTFPLS